MPFSDKPMATIDALELLPKPVQAWRLRGQTWEAKLAKDALNAIDELRDEYGAPESEPRHPDIESGRPWPMVG